MAEAISGIVNINTPVVMAFPSVTEARAFKRAGKEKGEPKFSASFVFPPEHPDFAIIKQTAIALAKAKWPGKDLSAEYKAGNFKMPWEAGDKLADKRLAKIKDAGKAIDDKGDFQRGNFIVKASSKFAPRLAYIENGKISADLEGAGITAHKGKFYFGVKVLAQINLVAYDGVGEDGKDGVTAYLNLVLSTNTGTRLAGGASASEVFKGYAGTMSTENPTGGAELDADAF